MKASTEASKAASRSSALKAGMSASVAGQARGSSARSSASSASLIGRSSLGLSQGIAEDEGIEREPKPRGLGVLEPGIPERAVNHLA